MEDNFKVGDRVTLVEPCEYFTQYKGQKGTVIYDSSREFMTVMMDDGETISGSYRWRWSRFRNPIKETPKMEFKPGEFYSFRDSPKEYIKILKVCHHINGDEIFFSFGPDYTWQQRQMVTTFLASHTSVYKLHQDPSVNPCKEISTNPCREAFKVGQVVPLVDGSKGKVVQLQKREGWVITYPYQVGQSNRQVSPRVYTSEGAAKDALRAMPNYDGTRSYWVAKIEWEE